jgi:hypothetical protein
MLEFLTVLIMLGVAYAFLREGLLTGFTMCVNVFIAGLVAFNFFEPIANELEQPLKGTFMEGCEDALTLLVLFALVLGLLRVATNSLANKEPAFPQALQRGGGAVCGLIAGYFVAGILLCIVETLPVAEDFLGFRYKTVGGQADPIRRYFPPDRAWLSLMQRAGTYAFSNEEDPKAGANPRMDDRYVTFDKYGTFELRYGRYRREQRLSGQGEGGEARYGPPLPYLGEFDKEIHKQ